MLAQYTILHSALLSISFRLGKPETLSFFKRREERHGSVGQGSSWYDDDKLIGRYHRAPPSEIQDAKLIINETKGS